ncbi:hypothetical protein [Vibrio parahaemolyticus]|uniref:hypothetical protein n=1 Tax=Vibrio parahaemolyticus TaxID=670 RepID=UPI00215CB607|nr:hypothetical protein [Vibrio parahaemolyticus]
MGVGTTAFGAGVLGFCANTESSAACLVVMDVLISVGVGALTLSLLRWPFCMMTPTTMMVINTPNPMTVHFTPFLM